MKNEEYALLMLDNMPLKGHFVLAKAIGYIQSNNLEEQKTCTVYEDIVMGNKIYPSSYDISMFINQYNYIEHLKGLKWTSREIISKDKAMEMLKSLNRSDLLSYEINMYTSIEKKNKDYDEIMKKYQKILKK